MSTEQNKAVARRFLEELARGNFDAFDELYAPDYVHHNHAMYPDLEPGLQGFKDGLRKHGGAFESVTIHIDDLIAEGDRVVARMICTGKQVRPFRGIPATGKTVTFTATDIYRLKDGRIVEAWAVVDFLGIMMQLGAKVVME